MFGSVIIFRSDFEEGLPTAPFFGTYCITYEDVSVARKIDSAAAGGDE